VLRVFSDRAYLPALADHIWQLSPFWGITTREGESIQPKRLARYMKESGAILELTSLERADLAIFPAEYQVSDSNDGRNRFQRFTRLAASAGKPTIVFTGGDLEHSLPEFNGYEFHTSLYRSTAGKNTFAMPATIGDIVEEELAGSLPLLPKEPRARVGFCGFAPPGSMPPGKEMLKENLRDLLYSTGLLSATRVGYAPRARAIRALKKSKAVGTNVVLRGNGGFNWACGYLLKEREASDVTLQRWEYLENLLGSPYALCVRGRGNYSLRFYEAMCCGRIPVFVNTDCVLPFEHMVNWKDYCVWVEERDIPHIGEILADFHANISSVRFKELQLACRRLWLDYLSPESFMRQLSTTFQLQRTCAGNT